MPELPEVEVVRRGLSAFIESKPRIEQLHFWRKDLRFAIPIRQLRKLQGQRLLSVSRRAKYLLFAAERGGFLSHLGMTGSWRLVDSQQEKKLHEHVALDFADGKRLIYQDPRRFGYLDLWDPIQGNALRLGHLGPEPLSVDFSVPAFLAKAKNKTVSVKGFLMDQRVVVGVGNIYAAEALFQAGIRPDKIVSRLKDKEVERLIDRVQSILHSAIELGGSSIRDYASVQGEAGNFQLQHQVYDRKGEPCRKCQTAIQAKVIAGRNSFWCAKCQR